MGCSYLRTSPAWALSMGYSPSGRDYYSVGPPQATDPARKPAPVTSPWSRSVSRPSWCGVLHRPPSFNTYPHGLPHGLQENLCSNAWSTSSPSFTDLAWLQDYYTFFSLHFHPAAQQRFYTFLHVITEAPPTLLMGSALGSSGSVLDMAGTDSVGQGGNSHVLSQKPLLQPLHYQILAM